MVFRSFAVIGAGNLGRFVVDELLRLKTAGTVSSVTAISRSDASASHPEWVTQGAKFAVVDYNNQSALIAALEDVEVVISTVKGTPEAVQSQKSLADAAKAAGVEIFVPSDFGGSASNPFAMMKIQVHEYLKEIGLPSAIFYTGAWTDLIFNPFFGFDLVNRKVAIPGIGDTPITFTGRPDIARYLGFIFTSLPAEKIKWRAFRLEGERTSFNEIFKSYQEQTGNSLEISHIPPSELEKRSDVGSMIALRWEKGEGVVGEPLDNDVYPGWNPKGVLEYLA